jgi:hypothetical protein
MNKKLESIIKKGKMAALAGIASLAVGCATISQYAEPRVGVMIPVAAEKQAYSPSLLIGADYGVNIKNTGVGVEAGIDYFHSSGQYIQTESIIPRVAVKFSPLDLALPDSKIKPFVSAGMSFLTEISAIDVPQYKIHDSKLSSTFGIDLGLGVSLFDMVNVNASYTILPSSQNVKGMLKISAGYSFQF